jgi:hypothetical protein
MATQHETLPQSSGTILYPPRDHQRHAAVEATGVKVYTGDNGLVVTMVSLKETGKFLIEVQGSMSLLDGLILPYAIGTSSGQVVYTTTYRATDYTFVHFETPLGGGAGHTVLYTPNDINNGRPLTFSEARGRTVKPGDLISRHEKQMKDGSIARFQRFDRKGEQDGPDKELAETTKKFNQACGTTIPVKIAWSTISDDLMRSYWIASFCGAPVSAMTGLCDSAEARKLIQAQVKQVTCQFGSTMKLEVNPQGLLTWTVFEHASNTEVFAKKYWENTVVPSAGEAVPSAAGSETPPWGQAKTLGERMILEKTSVCTDGKSSYAALAPEEHRGSTLFFGNGKKFWRLPAPSFLLGGNSFFDPRAFNPNGNPNYRGLDMRLISQMRFDAEKKTCDVRCGSRTTNLTVMDAKAASDLLRGSAFEAPLHKRTPHVLTRDEKGIYYYVDRGNTPETEKNFRLFVGPKGNVKLRAMTNIVADSNGEIFSTKSGSLRFIAGPGGADSSWIQGKKVTKLTAIPVQDNFALIYNELGPYTGERLGTPCDVW